MPALDRRAFCTNLMAVGGGFFLSRPLRAFFGTLGDKPSSLGDALLTEALTELGRVGDRGQRGELTRLLAPLVAPKDPELAMTLLAEGIQEADDAFVRLPKESQEELTTYCKDKSRHPSASKAIHETLTQFPVSRWEKATRIARDLEAGPRTQAAILARAYAAGQIPFQKLRRSCPEPIFRRLLSDSIGSYPLTAQQVNEILSTVQVCGFTPLERAETYANYLAQWPSAHRERLGDLIRSEAKLLAESGRLREFLTRRCLLSWYCCSSHYIQGPPVLDYRLAWDLWQLAESDRPHGLWKFDLLASIADNVPELHVPAGLLAKLKLEVESQPDPLLRAEMALALAHLMAHVPGSGALEYAYDATDSIIESKMGCFWWESYFGGLIRLHRLLRQSSIPQRYIDEALLTQINDNVSKLLYVQTLGWCFPPDWLAEIARELAGNAIELAEVDREGARRLLKIAAGLEPEWNAFGVHEAHAYIALASHQTGLEVTSPPLAQSLGQMACLDAEGDGSPRFGHILEDIARTNPQLALHVYPVLRTNQQRLSWLSAVGDAPKKQGPLFLRQIPSSEDEVVAARAADPNRPPFLRQVPDFDARLAAVARSMPKGYNRAKSLGMVSRILRKL